MKKVSLFFIFVLFGALGSLPAHAQYPYGNTTYATPSFVNLNQGAVSFVIGNKAYSGTGNTYNPQEFWEYDPATNAWTRKADFPGVNRLRAVAFSIGNKGYIGAGQLASGGVFYADFWEYDPASNTWTQKANIPTGRRGAVGFSIGNKGYVGTGQTAAAPFTNDFWEFDPLLNTWTQKANFPGTARRGAAGFAINDKGYMGTGQGSAGFFKDFWEYDPAGNTWTQKTDFAGTARVNGVGGASVGKGFIGTGLGVTNTTNTWFGDIHEYNPATNSWASRSGFAQRSDATGFAINGQIYIGLGIANTSYLPDFLRFSPYWEVRNSTGDYDEANGGNCFLYPMQYTGTWRGYLECIATGCYAGSAVNTLQNLGNACYLSRVEANPNLRGGFGWYGGLLQENARFCRRNYRITYQNQPVSPVGLQLYYTKEEIDNLISSYNSTFGAAKTYNDLVIIKYNGPNQDLDPANNSTNNSDYQKIIPTLTFYGNANQYVYAQFNVSSYSEYYLALADSKNYYVNDGSPAGDVYTTNTGSDSYNGSPSQPFATINHAISQAQPGDVIFVDAGQFAEDVIINKAIAIKGVKAGMDPGSLLTRGAETIVVPGTADPVNGTVFNIQTSDVVIDGLTIDGDNPSIAGTVTLNGADINKGLAIARYTNNAVAHNNLVFKNNIMKNFYRYGVFLQSTTTLPLSGNMISQNHFDNIPALVVDGNAGRQGRAVGLFNNGYASVTQNTFTRVHTAVSLSGFNAASQSSCSIAGNTIESYRGGISLSANNGAASQYLIDGNNISTADLATWDVPGADTWNSNIGIGVSNSSSSAGMNISNNTIDNTYEGVAIGRLSGPANYIVSGNTISNSTEIGLYYYNSSAVNASVQIENNTLVSNDTGIYIHYLGGTGGLMPVTLSNNAVTGGTLGLQFDGSQVALTGNTLSGSFTGQSGSYIQLIRNALNNQTIDASSLSFEGKTSAVMTLPELFATEDRIAHRIDYAGVGFLKIKPLNVFLTQNSYSSTLPIPWGTATTSADLQRAVGAAVTGDSIHVNAGSYVTTDFTLDKGVTILGSNYLASPNNPANKLQINPVRNTESIITGATINLAASNISFQGMTFDPGSKIAMSLNFNIVPAMNYGDFSLLKNRFIINSNSSQIILSGIGSASTAPSELVNSGFNIDDNRFEKNAPTTGIGNTFSIHLVKNVTVNNNAFVVTGSAFRVQSAIPMGNNGVVDNIVITNNWMDRHSNAVTGNRFANAIITGNTITNCGTGFNVFNTMAQSSSIEFSNNIVNNTVGGTGFIGYSRVGGNSPGASTIFKAENNIISGIAINGLGGQVFGAMNITINNSVLNPSYTIRGNTINFTGDFSSADRQFVRPITLRGNIKEATIENNELSFNPTGTLFLTPNALPESPGITINSEFGATAYVPSNALINILNNKVTGFKQSVIIHDGTTGVGALNPFTGYGNLPAGAIVNISNNSFASDSMSINNGEVGEIINATCNWYGSPALQNVLLKVTETTVNHSPWLINGTDNDVATGFQPVANSCLGQPKYYVNDDDRSGDVFTTAVGRNSNNGSASSPFATLDYAYSIPQPGDTIYVDAGTYNLGGLTYSFPKAMTFLGANYQVSPNDPSNKLLPNPARHAESILSNGKMSIASSGLNMEGFTWDVGNRNGVELINSAVTNNDFGNFKFAKNIYRITHTSANINSFTITGKFVTSPNLPVTSSYTIADNRFEKSGTVAGTTFNFNYVKDISVTANSFVVTGSTVKTQLIANLGNTGIVDNYIFENNVADGAGIIANCARVSSGIVAQNILTNCDRGLNVTGTMLQSSSLEFNNNTLIQTTGGTPFLGYNRSGSNDPSVITTFKVQNNIITGTRVDGLSGQFYGAMNFTISNSEKNSVLIINENKINFIGDFSSVGANEVRPITVRGNIGNLTMAKNEVQFLNSGTLMEAIGLPANPAFTIGTDNGPTAFMSSNAVINILNNKIQGFKQSVVFYDVSNHSISPYTGYGNIPAGASVNINNNSFTGDSISINSGVIGAIVNANCNWYGSAAAHNVTPRVSETTVEYTPWLTNGTDTDVATGFQPVANSCNGVPVDADIILVTNVTCFGAANGTIDAFVEEGVAPFTYAWSKDNIAGFSSLEDIDNLAPGVYQLIVTDVNGSADTVSATITEPPLLTVVMTGTTASCIGSATATPDGGTSPYTYSWSNGASTQTITGVPSGTYTVTVTDANSCTVNGTYTIVGNSTINPSTQVVDVTCFGGSNGSITVTSAGGTAPHTYSINGGAYQTSNVFAGLTAGTYIVSAKDATGCFDFVTKTITEPVALLVVLDSVTTPCFSVNNGRIFVTATGGNGGKNYSWTGPNGFTSTSQDPANLFAGTYNLVVTDANGCTASLQVVLDQAPAVSITEIVTNVGCRGALTGAINTTITGGSGAGLTYSWTGPLGFVASTEDISGLRAGNYTLNVTDPGNGCVTTKLIVVTQPATTLGLTTSRTNVNGCISQGTIIATASGGTSPYQYSVDGVNYQSSGLFSNLSAGSYTVYAKDAGECIATKLADITDNGSDQYEGNNSKNQAKPIALGTVANARIALAADVADWFRFTTTAGGNYLLTFTHPTISYTFNMFPAGNNAPALGTVSSSATTKEYALAGNTTYFISITGGLSFSCYNLLVAPSSLIARTTNGHGDLGKGKPVSIPMNAMVYPNPHKGSFTLKIASPEEGLALIELFTVSGQVIAAKTVELQQTENNLVPFSGIKAGTIFYRVRIGKEVLTGKVIGIE